MSESAGKPQIRFKGFTDAWEQRKLGDLVVSHNAGVYIPKEQYGFGVNIIGVSNIYDSDVFNGEIYKLGPVSEKKYLLEKGDLIYGESSLVPEGIARTVYVGENGVNSAFAWHTRRVKLKNDIINSHVAALELNYLNSVRNYLISVSTQTALTGMTTEGYFGSTLSIPSMLEQNEISRIFTNIDNLITLHQRKYEKLVNVKKSLLEKMFPCDGETTPKIRFKGFSDAWEQRKFGEIFDFERPDNYTVVDTHYVKQGTPVLTANKSFILGYTQESGVYDKGNCIIFDDFTLDSKYVDFPFKISSSGIKILTSTPSYNLKFAYYLLNSTNILMQGHARHYISIVQPYFTNVPILNEQNKIEKFVTSIDNLITLHQSKLEKLKNIKKSLLEKMFA